MKLKNVLKPSVVVTSLKGETKEEIIEELLDILVKDKQVKDRHEALKDLVQREQKMSTGIQYSVAIPHAKTKAVTKLAACIGIKKEGIDFASLDGEPSKIFIMTLSPVDRVGPHVQFLAEVSMVLKSKKAREILLEAETAQDVLAVFGL
ncbi:MAG: PTS sugar transporter subunit IIA [Sphaerochaetaceae bacterium]